MLIKGSFTTRFLSLLVVLVFVGYFITIHFEPTVPNTPPMLSIQEEPKFKHPIIQKDL